jgi:signal transduction histidine kinase
MTNGQLASRLSRLQSRYRRAAHDLRAPLNTIGIHLDLIRQDFAACAGNNAAGRSAQLRIELLQQEVKRLSGLLHALLAPDAAPSRAPLVFDLKQLLREVVRLVEPQADQLGVRIALRVTASNLTLPGSRDQLERALLNLLINALESMPDGGSLEVDAGNGGTNVGILIRDHGVGIPARNLARAFQMDFSTKPGNSGLGLLTSRVAIEAMGGTLTLQSVEGAGTTARVEIPLVAARVASETACSTS